MYSYAIYKLKPHLILPHNNVQSYSFGLVFISWIIKSVWIRLQFVVGCQSFCWIMHWMHDNDCIDVFKSLEK